MKTRGGDRTQDTGYRSELRPQAGANLGSQFLLLSQEFTSFKGDVEDKFSSIEGQLSGMRAEFRDWMREKQPQYYRYATVGIAIAGVIWWIINAQIVAISRENDKDNTITRELASNNAVSITNMSRSVSDLTKAFAGDHAERVANEREIETQFDADGQLRNVQWATTQRRLNDYQNTLADMGAKWPHAASGPYFEPNIAHRRDGDSVNQ